jgi:DNA invertase Pin-like site-specific DNA recombinase
MFQIIGAMAEFERSLIRERVVFGLKNARAKGVTLGRPRAQVEVAELARMRGKGMTLGQIAATKISPATVSSLLKEPAVSKQALTWPDLNQHPHAGLRR